jgi:hypothetical protein
MLILKNVLTVEREDIGPEIVGLQREPMAHKDNQEVKYI